MNDFILTSEDMEKLEKHSCNLDDIKTVLSVIENKLVIDCVDEDLNTTRKFIHEIACITTVLLNTVKNEEKTFDSIINSIFVDERGDLSA